MIRAYIADDEALAREGLRLRLDPAPDVEIVGEAASGRVAVEGILALRPDLVFLDIEMPELNGFEVIAAVGSEHLPRVVFVTAFDQYAIRAFDAHAVDYLLKPVSAARLAEALARVRRDLALHSPLEAAARVNELLESRTPGDHWLDRFVVSEGDRVILVRVEEVDWIGAAGNYVELHLGARTLLLRERMSELADRLDPLRFARIHRSSIVNLARVRKLLPERHGDGVLVLESGARLKISRSYRREWLARP
ncbi:MAG: response regulator [Candidatus Eisenbacteria bacterium]